MKFEDLTREQIENILLFFQGKNTTPRLEGDMLLIRGDFTNDVLQALTIQMAFEIVCKKYNFYKKEE